MQPIHAATFLFLAAGAAGLFAFLSIAGWVRTRAQERKDRDRFALLKAIAEQPGESAQRVLDLLREDEERERARKEREERKGYLVGGLTCLAAGVGLSVMLLALSTKPGTWTVGLIPLLVGVVLTGMSLLTRPGR
jgi:hypothetical protein